MLLNTLFDFAMWLFEVITDLMPSLSPAVYTVNNTLSEVISFGVWVIGSDMWIHILSLVSAWLTFKIAAGVVLFVYRLIPFI